MPSIKSNLLKWIKSPATWLSLIALIMSGISFFLALPRKPALAVYLTEKLGVQISASGFDLVVPTFLYNKGSSGTVLIVQNATARAHVIFEDKSTQDIDLAWVAVRRLVRSEQPKKADPTATPTTEDYFATESRSIPFAVEGKKVEFKYLEFWTSQTPAHFSHPFNVELVVTVSAVGDRRYRSDSLRYHLSEKDAKDSLTQGIYVWPGEQ